jgi:hypothetical protein
MISGTSAAFGTLLSIDTATFTGSYQLLGVLASNARMITLVNGSDEAVTVSFDGTNDNLYFGASNATPQQFPLTSLRTASGNTFEMPKGTSVFVKGSAGTGLFTLSYVIENTPSPTYPGT